MVTREPKNPKQPDARDSIERVREASEKASEVLKNPLYIQYALGKGPITFRDIPKQIQDESKFLEVVETYDWPSDDDADIEPSLSYTDHDFLENLFIQPSGDVHGLEARELDIHQLENIDEEYSHKTPRALNNFMALVRATPIDNPRQANDLEGLYGLMPALHRMDVLAPDLLQAVRDATNAFPMAQQDFAQATLGRTENQDIVTCLNMTYRIMGRLLKVGDQTEPITSAHDALTR